MQYLVVGEELLARADIGRGPFIHGLRRNARELAVKRVRRQVDAVRTDYRAALLIDHNATEAVRIFP